LPFEKLTSLESVGDCEFKAPASPDKGDFLFGGQLLAQSLTATAATGANDRQVHSLHAYFLRPGDVDVPGAIRVEAIRDGRSFSWREAVARQRDKELFRLLASYQVPVESPEFIRRAAPSAVSPAVACTTKRVF